MIVSATPFRRALMTTCAALAVAAGVASPALAWKPKTHVYLAEEAMRDALDDGKLVIYETDHGTGRILGELGRFDADPKILAALKAAPRQYRAGVLGPDAYPDILTGQQVIHPDEAESLDGAASGSNAWMTHLWRRGFQQSDSKQVQAFTVGYLAHAAGDVFAHTYVNHYAGGEFMLTPDPRNALRHLVLEGYVGKRTPQTMSAVSSRIATGAPCNQRKQDDLGLEGECGIVYKDIHAPITGEDTSIEGVHDFIYRELTYAAPGGLLEAKLLKGAGTEKSIPFIYSTLRNKLQAEVDAYDRTLAGKSGLDRTAHETLHGGAAEDKRKRIARIDRGLAAFPAVSHEVAKALVYNENGADIAAAKAALDGYVRDHLAVMAGVSNGLKNTVFTISDVVAAIMPAPLQALIGEMMKAPLDLLVKGATGKNAEEWGSYLKNPEQRFDEVLTRAGGGHDGEVEHNITLAAFNREQLKLDDDGYKNPSLKWKVEQLPPAFNTLQLNKMLLLGDAGRSQLAAALRAKGASPGALPPADGNAMLGWVRSLDRGNQWQGLQGNKPGASPRPFFSANGGSAYRKLFLIQIGEKGAEHAHSPSPAPATPTPPSGGGSGSTPATAGGGAGGAPALPPVQGIPTPTQNVRVSDIVGSWASSMGNMTITAGGDGAFVEVQGARGGPHMISLSLRADSRAFEGDWRALDGAGAGRLTLTPTGPDSFVVSPLTGRSFADLPPFLVYRAAGGAAVVQPTSNSQPPASAPPVGSAPPPLATPGQASIPTPRQGPAPSGGSGGFVNLAKNWEVKFDGAKAYDDRELHVFVTVKNVSTGDIGLTPGNFIPRVKNADDEWMDSRLLYRASVEPPQAFRPTVPSGETVKLRFVFRPDARSAQLTTFSIAVFGEKSHHWDVSHVRLGSLSQ